MDKSEREIVAIAIYESHQRACILKGAAWHKLAHKERIEWRERAEELLGEEDYWENDSGW